MSKSPEELLGGYVVETDDGARTALGFLIAPGKVLTDLTGITTNSVEFVVRRHGNDEPFDVQGVEYELAIKVRISLGRHPLVQNLRHIGVLSIEATDDQPCVGLDLGQAGSDRLLIGGYEEFIAARGKLNAEPSPRSAFLRVAYTSRKSGLAGAPVLNLRSGGVWAIVVGETLSPSDRQVVAIPLAEMAVDLADVIAANRAFHERDDRWLVETDQAHLDHWVEASEYVSDKSTFAQWLDAIAHPKPTALPHAEPLLEDDPPGLLFRLYIPSDRLFADEQRTLLDLFRDWLFRARGQRIREEGYRTAAGQMFEWFGDPNAEPPDLRQQYGSFREFLDLCIEDPSAATDLFSASGMAPAASADLVAKYGRQALRLKIDLKCASERVLSAMQPELERHSKKAAALSASQVEQLRALATRLRAGLSDPQSLDLLAGSWPAQTQPLIQVTHVTAQPGSIMHYFQGTAHVASDAQQVLDLIDRVGTPEAEALKTAVHQVEDAEAPSTRRRAALRLLERFRDRLLQTGYQVGTEALSTWLASRMPH